MLLLFIKGLVIGFAIAAPVGPIGVLCIQRSLHNGFKIGLMTGFGAAMADSIYGLVAGFGLTAVSAFLISYQFWIQLFGGLFLLYLGIKLFFSKVQEQSKTQGDKSAFHAFGTSFLLTLTNPATILSFLAVFAGLGLGSTATTAHAIALVLGITTGSALWWLLLSSGVSFILHHRLTPSTLKWINRLSGMIILGFGAVSILMSKR